ncbi:nucleolar complex protein 2 homolog isoform X2 [Cynara cardunculus var. scolymus]|uniref:nucleolar complex protein 2 homolog isoform X2 n=1 Tax=Cynara cardunculus var. scolymus TaxID=59895 RepID=UPI000D6311DF|nr:nucleolar complex protein 2 homolog isoform X2 [Cynara cardunculus var. scolymus]
MGKLGKKARKFAKKNLPSVLKQRRKNKIVFKKRPSKKDTKDAVEKEVVKTAELSNGRDSEREVTVTTSLDVLFAEDDNIIVSDDSDSDGYLSEDPNCEKLSGNDNDVPLEDDRDERALSPHNQKIYEELAKQKNSLEKLKKKDKKFVKFLESYNKGEISQNQEMYSDEDETGEDLMMLDDSTTTKHKMLTCSTINLWSKLVTEEHSESALIGLLNAYRAACHLGPEETGFIDAASCPVIQDSDTFCNIYTFILSEADNIFRGLLKIPSSTCKKESILELKNTPRWKKAKPMIKSYLRSTLFLLKQVTDSEILAFSITRLRASIVFFAAFPSLLSRLIKIIVPLWATGGGTLSASSSLVIQDVVSVFGSNYFDTCFIKTYKAYIARCRSMETVDAKHIEFLRDSFVNLCSLDVEKSCKKALVSIQQLANILQHARQKDNKEAIRKIYSWQYAQCIDIWVLFISANVHECDIQPLLYITIQLINGVAHLFPGPRYLPLRIRCIHWLNKLSSSCGIYIPIASLVLDMLDFKVSKEGGKSRKSAKLASNLKLPKFWLKSQNFMEQCVYSAVELLAVHFMQWSYHISFPELGTTSLIRLRKFHEKTSVESLRRVVKRLMDQVEQNVEFVQKKRDEVAFSPKDHESVDQFLQFEKGTVNSPFMQYYRSVVEKAASKMSTSPVEPKGVKRKKIDTANGVITPFAANGNADAKRGKQKKADTANGDDNTPIAANGNVDSKGKKRKS